MPRPFGCRVVDVESQASRHYSLFTSPPAVVLPPLCGRVALFPSELEGAGSGHDRPRCHHDARDDPILRVFLLGNVSQRGCFLHVVLTLFVVGLCDLRSISIPVHCDGFLFPFCQANRLITEVLYRFTDTLR